MSNGTDNLRTSDVHTVVGGVTIPWLMKAFRMGRTTVERKLIGVQPIGQGRHNTPLYDLPEAAAYLVKPKVDIEKYIKDVGVDALPERLREAVWSAKLKRQRWEEKAGHLWHTQIVLSRLGELLQSMRVKLQLIPDKIERTSGLTAEQRRIIGEIVDDVQEEMYQEILTFAQSQTTPSQLTAEDDFDEDAAERKFERDDEDLI